VTGYYPKFTIPNLPNASCNDKTIDPDIFYADDCQIPDKAVVEKAREICLPCVERVACLMWALQNETFGMWGGMTANERRYFKQRKMKKLEHLKDLGLI
jgi:hypothetical protein